MRKVCGSNPAGAVGGLSKLSEFLFVIEREVPLTLVGHLHWTQTSDRTIFPVQNGEIKNRLVPSGVKPPVRWNNPIPPIERRVVKKNMPLQTEDEIKKTVDELNYRLKFTILII